MSLPLQTAWALHKAWPASKLVAVDDEGHGGEAMIAERVRGIVRAPGVWAKAVSRPGA